MKATTLAGLSAALLSAGSAQAAMEVANIAASDNRFGTIALLAVPVLGWVGFNILGERAGRRAAPQPVVLAVGGVLPLGRSSLASLSCRSPAPMLVPLLHALPSLSQAPCRTS